ncbi:glycosyltransferase [Patescibacteria group bacterium]
MTKPIFFSNPSHLKGKILILAQEIYPQICVGGLGKFVSGISKGLVKNGWQVAVFVPADNQPVYLPCSSASCRSRNQRLTKDALTWCFKNRWFPTWLWVQDWEGVYQADYWRKIVSSGDFASKTKIVWTIHSPITAKGAASYGYSNGDSPEQGEPIDWGDDFFDFGGLIKKGVEVVDVVTAVSKTFASNLDRLAWFSQARDILGINNGLDFEDWNPVSDNCLKFKLRQSWSEFKITNKRFLQKIFGLPFSNKPVLAFVSRLVPQKGVDLLIQVLPRFLSSHPAQLIVVGSGLEKYRQSLRKVKQQFPNQLGLRLEADFTLPHQVFAGADFLLLPSFAEPFGLVVAEARSYGAVPIVHGVDGLADQVKDGVDGFSFTKNNPEVFLAKLDQAWQVWSTSKWWQLSEEGKKRVTPWRGVAGQYEKGVFKTA